MAKRRSSEPSSKGLPVSNVTRDEIASKLRERLLRDGYTLHKNTSSPSAFFGDYMITDDAGQIVYDNADIVMLAKLLRLIPKTVRVKVEMPKSLAPVAVK
jgi:hypothetical protein